MMKLRNYSFGFIQQSFIQPLNVNNVNSNTNINEQINKKLFTSK
jgi:hypothetical protein